MNDAENLSKLLTHLPPAVFHGFMESEFGLEMAALDPKQGKREQRAAMQAELSSLSLKERQQIEEVAERLVLLSDPAGQDVVNGFGKNIFDQIAADEFAAIDNQYQRSLWLYVHERALFDEALQARQADVFRQSASCYSGFVAPKGLTVAEDEAIRKKFHEAIAGILVCAPDQVAVQVFRRPRAGAESGADVELHQISIHYNQPPEVVDRVEHSQLVPQDLVRAISSYVTYEPGTGYLEVLSKDATNRQAIVCLVADTLLQSPINGEKIPLKQYDYQSLAAPRNFDVGGESISSVKVTELGYSAPGHRSMRVAMWSNDPDDIHSAARTLISPTFAFSSYHIDYAKVAIHTKKVGKDRARTIVVVLRDQNKCNVKTKRERDRALCDRLLAKWNLVKEIAVAGQAPADQLAA